MNVLLQIEGVAKTFLSPEKKEFKAIDQISFSINKGEIFAIVGESGSGKSTLAKVISGLLPPSEGAVFFGGENIWSFSPQQWKGLRQKMQIVFQDAYASLNTRMTVEQLIKEPLAIHGTKKDIDELLELVGLDSSLRKRYSKELSGGQCRRVNLARALSLDPVFLILDEVTSGLDLTIQADLINLILEMQKKLDLTCLFISHDLDVVKYLADRVGVMKNGRLVEWGTVDDVFTSPKHPYTENLLSARLSII